MKIALISDTHNHIAGVSAVLRILDAEKITTVIHCGDLTRAETLELFQNFTIHHVWGNGDLDAIAYQIVAQSCKPSSTTSEVYSGIIAEKRVAALHGHQSRLLTSLIENGNYDYVFHGHTHRKRDELIGRTRVINPGAVGGMLRSLRSCAILDLKSGDLSSFQID
jgi:hypothetical protein